MFNLFFGRIISYVGIGLIASIILGGAYLGWKKQIELQALTEYNQKQLEQTIKDQQVFSEKMSAIENSQKDIIKNLEKQNRDMAIELKSLKRYLDSPEVKKLDKPASDIIKNTIDTLRN